MSAHKRALAWARALLVPTLALLGCVGTPLSLELSPPQQTVAPGGTARFVVSSNGAADVSWSVTESGGGTIDSLGIYTAPQTPGRYHVRATAKADGAASATAQVDVALPALQITALTATPALVPLGWPARLAWVTVNAEEVTLSPAPGAVAAFGALTLHPQATQVYTLTARRGAESVTRSVTLEVGAARPPEIQSFTATPAALQSGDPALLAWRVEGADALVLDRGIGPVTGQGLVVHATSTAVYTLTAANAQGTSTATVTLVVKPPVLGKLSADPPLLEQGAAATLSWTALGAAAVVIDHGIGDVTGRTEVSVSPDSTTDYTLTASAGLAVTTAVVRVEVTPAPAPVIVGFLADPAEVVAGAATRLSWSAAHASKVTLDPDLGALATSGQREVTPTSTTTYLLSATGPGGAASATATVTVRAVAPPQILDFSATPSTIALGQTAALQWLTQGAATVSIDHGVGLVTATSTDAALAASGVFTLTATGPGGTVTAKAPVTVLPVNQGPPSFSAAKRVLAAGESTTLTWTALGATKVTLDHGVGAVTGGQVTVKPAVSTTYLLTLTYPTGVLVLPETVTVHPATAGVWIASFAADASLVRAGQPTTLRWAVSNATQVQLDQGQGTVAASGSVEVSPSATTTWRLTATDGRATVTASVRVVVDAAPVLAPADPGGAPDLLVTVDTGHGAHPISPFIYGVNAAFPNEPTAPYAPTLVRLGGTRWGVYNWETNASCAGADFFFLNDVYLGGGLVPAGAVLPTLRECQDRSSASSGCATMVTIPNQGWVAADRAGPVAIAGPQPYRFHPTVPRKGAPFSVTPDTTDRVVYQDELAWALAAAAPLARTDAARPLHFELGNEPDIYADRHAEVQHAPLTYAALIAQTIGSAAAVKDAVPGAVITAPALSGWHSYFNLQDAPDAAGRNFLDFFLAQLKAASDAQGRRLLDALDVHFYPDVWCGQQRISEPGPDAASPCAAATRVQLPRSLWDPAFVEESWITKAGTGGQTGGGPVMLLPRLRAKVAAGFPGTDLALTEYRYGGGGHISGAVAEADALGIFGREGVWSASYFPAAPVEPYIAGAFRAFRDFDGAGAAFGDRSVSATSSDVAKVAAYASVDGAGLGRVVLVLINRDLAAHAVAVKVSHTRPLRSLAAWQIAEPVTVVAGAVRPQALPKVTLAKANAALLSLPAMSVTTAVLSP